MDESLREYLEPHSSPSKERLKVLKEFKKTNASTGIHLMPIIPYLTDNKENLDAIYQGAHEVGVDYVLPGTLYLIGKTKNYFMDFVKDYNEDKYQQLRALYVKGSAGKEYKEELYSLINELKQKYHVSSNYMKPLKERLSK
jgi:DNA repair photolyase